MVTDNKRLLAFPLGMFSKHLNDVSFCFRSLAVFAAVLIGAVQPSMAGDAGTAQSTSDFHRWAATPPMGWNSWDCFGTTLNETQAKAQAEAMARLLKPHGWNYFTVDIQWYEGASQGHAYKAGAPLSLDEYSRLVPAPRKFPSATNGAGFRPLADYVHAQGLKFGIHLMRGIPRQAVRQNTSIKGTTARAADIALTNHICLWKEEDLGTFTNDFGRDIPIHGAGLYRLTPLGD